MIEAAGIRTGPRWTRRPTPAPPRLRALGAGPGERVVITLPTGADLVLALFAVARAGLIAVPTSPSADVAALADRVGALASIGPTRDRRLGIAVGAADLSDWWAADPEPVESIGGGRTWRCWREPAGTGP